MTDFIEKKDTIETLEVTNECKIYMNRKIPGIYTLWVNNGSLWCKSVSDFSTNFYIFS